MSRTVSATEAKNAFGSLVEWAATTRNDIIVESRGEPKVAIIAYDEYQRLVELRERARREQALARLEGLRERVRSRNPALTEQEAERIADQVTREAVKRLVAEGRVSYDAKG